jgi:hypothetical protein
MPHISQGGKQATGNYSSPVAEDIGETKIFDSNKGGGR